MKCYPLHVSTSEKLLIKRAINHFSLEQSTGYSLTTQFQTAVTLDFHQRDFKKSPFTFTVKNILECWKGLNIITTSCHYGFHFYSKLFVSAATSDAASVTHSYAVLFMIPGFCIVEWNEKKWNGNWYIPYPEQNSWQWATAVTIGSHTISGIIKVVHVSVLLTAVTSINPYQV